MSKQFSCFRINTKFRIIIGIGDTAVCFYTTKKQILAGVGDLIRFNDALQVFLCAFEGMKVVTPSISGYGGTCRGYQMQINLCVDAN